MPITRHHLLAEIDHKMPGALDTLTRAAGQVQEACELAHSELVGLWNGSALLNDQSPIHIRAALARVRFYAQLMAEAQHNYENISSFKNILSVGVKHTHAALENAEDTARALLFLFDPPKQRA